MGDASEQHWSKIAERGTVAGIWFVVTLATIGGRRPARAFTHLLVPYYLLFAGRARRSSQDYLRRALGEATLPMVYRHILRFAQIAVDRLFFVRGKVELFDVRSHGEEHLWRLLEEGRGAILLGAHLGSFEAMQRMADARSIPINIVGYFRNARMFNSVLERLNPRCNARLISLAPNDIDVILQIRDRLDRGELVAILADRTLEGQRAATVEFFGSPARFPTGPYLLASMLKCPVYLVFGLHRPPDRYDLYCEPFADELELPRRGREQAPREQGIFGLGSAYSNTILVGLPIISAGLGEAAVLPLFMLISIHSAVLFSVFLVFMERGNGAGHSARQIAAQTLNNLIRNPLIIGLAVGLAFNLLNIPLPQLVDDTLTTLGKTTLPCALFVLGASLNAYKIAGHFAEAWTMVGLKLALQPLLVWLLAFGVFRIDPLWGAVAVMTAGMPVGINSYILAQQYKVGLATLSTAILLSTLLAGLSQSLLLALFV